MPSPLSFFHPSRRLVCLCLPLLLLAGCGRGGRMAARRQIEHSKHAYTPQDFVRAAAEGNTPLVEAYLRAGMDRNAADPRGYTALMAAAVAGKTAVLKTLLDENAKPDLLDKDGDSALTLAAEAGQAGSVRTLVEGNADVRVRDHKGRPALLKAVSGGFDPVVDVLLSTSRDSLARDGQLDAALSVAALLGNAKITGLLLDKGARINAALDKGQTALMYAATYGKTPIVTLLLARGADARLVNADGASASVLALQNGHPDVAKLLDGHTPAGPVPPAVPGKSSTGSTASTGVVTPAPIPGATPQPSAAEIASVAMERTWLKENGVEPVTVLKKDTGQDDDGDGFTNDEELAAGTDPNDPKSHPPYYTKLRLRRVEGEQFPVEFLGMGKGGRVSLSVRGPGGGFRGGGTEGGEARTVEVGEGERVPGQPFRVVRVRARTIAEKDTGNPLDVSELTLANVDTGRKTVLVKGTVSNSPDATALLVYGIDHSTIPVRVGQQFTLPRDAANTRYEVVDIRPQQVVLRVAGSGQTVTVESEK